MISTTTVLFTLSLLAPSYVLAKNDWSVPCVTGSCSWDTGDGKTTAYSSMAISGTNNLLSDITPAAGWNVQGCNPNWASGEHTFQITCSGSSTQTALCSHLFDGGAENTIVRLPENCGKGPFARVVSISNSTGSSIARRKEGVGSQHTIQLDYNFSKIPTSRGKASFAITSTNIPGLPGVSKRDLARLRGRGRAGALHRRKFGQLQERSVIGDAADAVTSAAASAATAIGNAVSSANTIDKTLDSGPLTPVNFDKDVTLFDQSISCNSGDVSGSASLKVDVEGSVQGTVSFGATIVGTIVPPEVSDFSVNANLGGSASATFTIDATAQGQFGTGKVSLFKTGLPGLSIPSVVTIGPEFSIDASIDMDIEAEAKMVVKAGWDFPSLKLVFPASKGGSTGSATVSGTDNPLQLSADPSVDISGTVTGHLIPRVDFGIDLFDGTAQASVFIDVDTSASVNMEVKASAQIDNSAANATSSAAAADPTPTAGNNATDAAGGNNSTDTDTGNNNSTDTDAVGGNNSTDTDLDADGGNNSTDTDPTGDFGNSTSTDPDADGDLDIDTTGNSTSTDPNGDADPDTDGDLDNDTTGNSTSTDPDEDTTGDEENGDDPDGLDGDLAGNSTSADPDADTTDTTDPDADSDGTDPEDGTDPADGDITGDGTEDDPSDGDAQSDNGTDDTQDGDGTEDDNSGFDNSVDDGGDADPSVDDGLDGSSDPDDGSDTVDDGSNDTADDSGVDDTTDDSSVDDTSDDSGDDTADDSDVDDTSDDSGVDDTSDDSGDDTADDSGVDDTADDSDVDDPADDSEDQDTADDSDDSEDQDTADDGTADDTDDTDADSFVRKRDDSGSVSGCVTVNGAIDVTAGVTGSLEPFISDATTSFDIFSTQTQLFQKCLGNGGQERRRALRRRRHRAGGRRPSRVLMPRAGDSSGLQCPAKIVNALTSLI